MKPHHRCRGTARALFIRAPRVYALAPAFVAMRKVFDDGNSFPDPDVATAGTTGSHHGGGIATPEKIVLPAVFVSSDECPFMNATCLTVDGGLSVRHHPA